jgi:Tfp pilus assembly protein PilN
MKNPFLKPSESSSSFLPQDYVARKNELRANLICLSLFGVVMFGVITAFFVTNRQWLQVKREHEAVELQYTQERTKIDQLNRLEAQQTEMADKAVVTTALLENVPRSTLISELVTRMPADCTLLEVQLVSKRVKDAAPAAAPAAVKPGQAPAIKNLGVKPAGGVSMVKSAPEAPAPEKVAPPKFEFTIKLVGVAKVNNNVADYIQALKACPVLDNVDLKTLTPTTIEKLDLRKFEIEASIRKGVDARSIQAVPDLRAATVGGLPGDDPKRAGGTPQPKKPTVTAGEKEE